MSWGSSYRDCPNDADLVCAGVARAASSSTAQAPKTLSLQQDAAGAQWMFWKVREWGDKVREVPAQRSHVRCVRTVLETRWATYWAVGCSVGDPPGHS